MIRIFISHSSRHDRALALSVAERLRAEGFRSIFLSTDQSSGIAPGQNWEQELYAELRRCDLMIYLSTAHSVQSKWCFAELVLARSLAKPVIPIQCEAGEQEMLLRDTQWIDYNRDPDSAFVSLWRTLRQRSLLALPTWDQTRHPYPGLNAFEADDAAVFFGRNEEIERLLSCFRNRLDRRLQAVIVVGPSGSGKSSLVRAGLLPRLGRLEGKWRTVRPFTPQESVGEGLLSVVARHVAVAMQAPRRWRFVERQLRARPEGLVTAVRALAAKQEIAVERLLITVDQIEELVTVEEISADERTGFARMIEASTFAGSPVWMVATLRAEFLSRFLSEPSLAALAMNQTAVGPLDSVRLRRVIEGPASVAKVMFEDGLVDEIIRQTPGADALPLLAYCLQQLYITASGREPPGHVTVSDYRSLGSGGPHRGGIDAILVSCAERAVESLAGRDEAAVLHTLLRFVNLDGHDEPTKRLVRLSDLAVDEAQVVSTFVEHRLLVSKRAADGVTYADVAHEALFRTWTPLAEAIEAQRSTLRLRSDVERLAAAWAAADRDVSYCLGGTRLRSVEQLIAAGHLVPSESQLIADFLKESLHHDEAARTSLAEQFEEKITTTVGTDPELALLLAVAAAQELGKRAETWRCLNSAVDASRLRGVFPGHEAPVLSVAFSPDGAQIATSSEDGLVKVWSVLSRDLVQTIDQHHGLVGSVCFSPDGQRLLTASADGTACIWDVASGTCAQRFVGHPSRVRHAAFSADGDWVVTSGEDGTARVWSTADGEAVAVLVGHSPGAFVLACAFSPDGSLIVSTSSDHTAVMWERHCGHDWRARSVLTGHEDWVRAPSFSPDGSRIATASEDGTARVWRTSDGALLGAVVGHAGRVRGTSWSNTGRRLLTASGDGTARLWDAETCTELFCLRGHHSRLRSAVFAPDGRSVATACEDGAARLWTVDEQYPERVIHTQHGRARRAAWSPAGDRIATALNDGYVQLWDASTLCLLAETLAHTGRTSSAIFTPDGRRVISSGWDGTIRVWPVGKPGPPSILARFEAEIRWLDVCRSGELAVAALNDGTVSLVNLENRSIVANLTGHQGRVLQCRFSTDGRILLSASEDRTVRLWDVAGLTEIMCLRGHQDWVRSASLSPNGELVASGSEDATVRLWDASSGQEVLRLAGHDDWVRHVSFSPDGERLVSCSGDRTVRVWMTSTGQCCNVLNGHEAMIVSAEYQSSGNTIVTASYDGTVRLWNDLPYDSLLELARARSFRDLSRDERVAYGLN